jgi:uncharacterized membrane protein YhaH (DUF805 family)
MSIPAHEEWFSTKIRRNRKSFMGAFATLLVALLCFIPIISVLADGALGLLALIMVCLPSGLAAYLLSAQRLRDIGVSGWFALLWFPINWIPDPFSIILATAFLSLHFCIPGSEGTNRFGEDPVKH